MRVIDNFELLMSHIDFVDPTDTYIVNILRRPKDCKALVNTLGSNETQRMIRTYFIDSIERLKSKAVAIKELCRSCNARAYLIVSPKDKFDCLLNLAKKSIVSVQQKNYSVKPEHLLRQAYCENHKSRRRQWILDLDENEMYGWKLEEVTSLVASCLKVIGKDPDELYEVPTRHGVHIISSPFNLQNANNECAMLYEGAKKGNELEDILEQIITTAVKNQAQADWDAHRLHPFNAVQWFRKFYSLDSDPELFRIRKALEAKQHDITGWLHKDGMTLLYYEASGSEEKVI